MARYDDDLFKDSTMTFGEHLEELRTCLIRSLIGIALGVAFGIALCRPVVHFLESPMRKALAEYYREQGKQRLDEFQQEWRAAGMKGRFPPYTLHLIDDQRMLFEVYQLDPTRAWNLLADRYPNQLSDIRLPLYDFRESDLVDPIALAARISGETDDEAVAHIVRLLKQDEKDALSRIAAKPKEMSKHKEKLLGVLNRLANERGLYDEEAFSDVRFATSDLGLAERVESLAPDDELPWFNRRVLATVFSGLLTAPEPFLVPTFAWREPEDDPRTRLKTLNAPEPFMIFMKAALVTGFVIAGPWVFFQIWLFVAAGLYPHERNYVYIYGPMSLGLFMLGVATAFIFVFEPVLNFLMSFNEWLGLDPDPRISEYLGFVLFLPLGFGVSFQLPLVMLFLERIGVFSIDNYVSKWRIAILVISIVSAFLTPQDPWSMALMAVPLCLLYGVGILLCKYMPRPANPFDESAVTT